MGRKYRNRKSIEMAGRYCLQGKSRRSRTISQTPGAIGYIGSEYAFALKIPVAKLQNKAGNFVAPTTESISAAADIEMPADTRTMITDSPVADAYPISCFTWILLYQEQAYKNRPEPLAQATVELLNWLTIQEAQDITTKYIILPARLRQ